MQRTEGHAWQSAAQRLPRLAVQFIADEHPEPGTGNNDHNPPRIAPRNLFDVSLGKNNLFNADRYKVDLDLTAVNVANEYALYNFLSTFSGTHYITPRSVTGKVTFNF